MSEVKAYAEHALWRWDYPLGATSMDVQDNADAVRLGEALDLLIDRLEGLARIAERIDEEADVTTMGSPSSLPSQRHRVSLGSVRMISRGLFSPEERRHA